MLTLKKLYELCQHLNNRQCSIDEKVLTVAKYCRYIEDSMPDISVLNLNTIDESVRVFKKISAEVLKDGLNEGRLITIYLLASEICSELNDDETMQIIKACHDVVQESYNKYIFSIVIGSIPYILLTCMVIKVFSF